MYHELNRPDLISKIHSQQYNFFEKINNLNSNEAVVKSFLDLCHNLPIYKHYCKLNSMHIKNNISNRLNRIQSSDTTMNKRYVDIIGINHSDFLYNSNVCDESRCIITRWRLSNHTLAIEKGRYAKPMVH